MAGNGGDLEGRLEQGTRMVVLWLWVMACYYMYGVLGASQESRVIFGDDLGFQVKERGAGIRGSWFKKLVQAKTNNKNIYIKKVAVEEILKIKIQKIILS